MINWHTFYGIASFIFYKKEVDAMTLEQLNTALYEKMYAEQTELLTVMKESLQHILIQTVCTIIL